MLGCTMHWNAPWRVIHGHGEENCWLKSCWDSKHGICCWLLWRGWVLTTGPSTCSCRAEIRGCFSGYSRISSLPAAAHVHHDWWQIAVHCIFHHACQASMLLPYLTSSASMQQTNASGKWWLSSIYRQVNRSTAGLDRNVASESTCTFCHSR